MASERLIRELTDPDFGLLALWEDRSTGGPIGGPTREIVILTWRGQVAGLSLYIAATSDSDDVMQRVGVDVRRVVQDIPKRQSELVAQAARAILDVARDWSEDPSMSAEKIASSLRIDLIDVHLDAECPAVALWLEDVAETFHGHGVLANLDEHGDINDVSLQG